MNEKPTPNVAARAAGLVMGLAVAAFAIIVVPTIAGYKPPVEVVDQMPSLNSAGDHVYASLYIDDGTGVVTTPTDAGVYAEIAATPLTAGETDGSGCITASATTGKFTIAKRCGVGELRLVACIGDVNAGNTAAVMTGAWSRTRDGSTTQISSKMRKAEVVDAGTRSSEGCVYWIDDSALSDTYQFTYAVTVNGAAVTTRAAELMIEKLLNK